MQPSISTSRQIPLSRALAVLVGMAFLSTQAHAQDDTAYTLDAESKMWIDGTSTRSDWTVHAEDVEGSFGLSGTGEALQLHTAQFAVRATEIESRKSTIMDRLIDEALLVEEHPVIRYELSSAEPGSVPLHFNTGGTLTLGGQTKDVEMAVVAEPLDAERIRFTGSYQLKMSDYGLQPPVAMFGALRTGDEVTVHFDVVAVPAE